MDQGRRLSEGSPSRIPECREEYSATKSARFISAKIDPPKGALSSGDNSDTSQNLVEGWDGPVNQITSSNP